MEERIIDLSDEINARGISEIFERDSRRYSRALIEEQEAKIG